MSVWIWVIVIGSWLLVGEVIAAFTAALLPKSLFDRNRHFAWYWASARVLGWPLVLLIMFFYLLSIPVRIVHQHFGGHSSS